MHTDGLHLPAQAHLDCMRAHAILLPNWKEFFFLLSIHWLNSVLSMVLSGVAPSEAFKIVVHVLMMAFRRTVYLYSHQYNSLSILIFLFMWTFLTKTKCDSYQALFTGFNTGTSRRRSACSRKEKRQAEVEEEDEETWNICFCVTYFFILPSLFPTPCQKPARAKHNHLDPIVPWWTSELDFET